MPIYEYKCKLCKEITESLMMPWEKKDESVICQKCGGRAYKIMSAHGGYDIKGDNSASERPKQAGSFKKK